MPCDLIVTGNKCSREFLRPTHNTNDKESSEVSFQLIRNQENKVAINSVSVRNPKDQRDQYQNKRVDRFEVNLGDWCGVIVKFSGVKHFYYPNCDRYPRSLGDRDQE